MIGILPSKRRLAWSVWWLVFALAVALWLHPINIGVTRVALVACLCALPVGLLPLWWGHRKLRWLPLGFLVLAGGWLVAPGRTVNPVALRARYVAELRKFEDVRYVWGGENRLGVDCSGLLRKALLNASRNEGFATLNPELTRQSLRLWWRDNSAANLKTGGNGRARSLFATNGINHIAQDALLPGDFAITGDGVHALAYLGEGEWIEADPGMIKVVRIKVPAKGNPWFEVPVHLMRWRCLE